MVPKTKTANVLKMLWSSDQHTLHNLTPTSHILSTLSTFYYTAYDLNQIDLVVLGGDFFDRLVDASNNDLRKAEYWIKEFLQRCANANVIVRVLEGTSSHDWEQPEMFEVLRPEGLNLRWVKTLSTETIEELGITVMYVPDNMGAKSTDEIWEDALAILSSQGLKLVDFIFFHGSFKYQLPAHLNHHSHDEHRWQSIVKYALFAGHVHKPSENGKIYVSGSFDRIRHGEEHPKGAYYAECNLKTETFKATFYENKKSLPYITVKVTPEMSATDVSDKLMSVMNQQHLPPHSQLRVKGGASNVVNPIVESFKKEFPLFGFAADNVKTDEQIVDDTLYSDRTYQGVTLNAGNLESSLMTYLVEGDRLNGEDPKELSELLREFI